jgi:PleD family two-component response regulator
MLPRRSSPNFSLSNRSLHLQTCSDLCRQTCLVVDDNEFNLLPLKEMLAELGIQSTCLDNGTEAISMY